MYRGSEGEEEPEWVHNEKEQFSVYRDKNGDGYMDKEEVSVVEKCFVTEGDIISVSSGKIAKLLKLSNVLI